MSSATPANAGERLPYLLSALKTPRIAERLAQTAERARDEQWPYEQFLETLCEAEVFAREASGARQRNRSAGFPAHKTLEDFDFTAQPSAERPLVMHLAQLAWIEEHANVCLIGPPGTGKSHLAIALGIKACQHGYRVAFATAQQWVSRLEEAQERNTLDQELRRLERYQLLIVDEVGYLPLALIHRSGRGVVRGRDLNDPLMQVRRAVPAAAGPAPGGHLHGERSAGRNQGRVR